ncbi:MAG: anhydro-N-acetylmuramic acid kinase [Rhodospirillum sp.]|nr:anhydro-N-acetylmuramic acid kinase [Rhodospirillum sp.]MCF8490605.1 anhydro-N-acetylmuramic acid kinase [Rhodospirillum sp.]MCF8498948.1 anhydro-N-acetylmuramic acid kinase [Rhodospirillum sp.]
MPPITLQDVRDRAGPIWALGLMSGTSMDGVDAAFVRTDGEVILETGPALTLPYDTETREAIRRLLGTPPGRSRGAVASLEYNLTLVHSRAVDRVRRLAPMAPEVIGFHGHTLWHDPANRVTVQIGDGALLAAMAGIPVVNDFRARDVALGGQGAPLAPACHMALARSLPRRDPVMGMGAPGGEGSLAVLNLGGVGNVTWLPSGLGAGANQPPVAFDTGPGNALIDDWVQARMGWTMDKDGALATRGRVNEAVLQGLLDHPYFSQPAPKSLDRDAFSLEPLAGLSDADGAATLVAFTAESVARCLAWLPDGPSRWLVCGGGRRNLALMAALEKSLCAARGASVTVTPVETVGWDGDALEAQAFGLLAVRSLRNLPLSWPSTTGCPEPLSGGVFWAPPGGKGAVDVSKGHQQS